MNSLNLDPTQLSGNSKATQLKNSITQNSDDAKLRQSCEDFEAMFVKQMLDSMKSTINKSGFIKENMGEEIFDDMLGDEYAKSMAESSDFGIADMMYKQLAAKKYQ